LGEIRWSDIQVDREEERVKIASKWSAWYSRAAQMVKPELVGFFSVRSSVADGLVWIDGTSWQQFATEHEEEINWKDLRAGSVMTSVFLYFNSAGVAV
jgi:hypothetical protein